MAPAAATPKTKLSPVKLDPPYSSAVASSPPTRPEKVIVKAKNNVLEPTSPNNLASKLDAMSLGSPGSSPTKRVYHPSPAKENARPNGDKLQINLRPPEDDSPGMSEQAKKSLRSINALRGLTIDEIELINKPNVKRLATVTQLCTPLHLVI
jgi:cell cycle protein kinase DBF2